jgi:hypothetical protein
MSDFLSGLCIRFIIGMLIQHKVLSQSEEAGEHGQNGTKKTPTCLISVQEDGGLSLYIMLLISYATWQC